MKKEEAKQKVAELVTRFKNATESGQIKKYSEEETKKDFILPLFEALGWDVYNKKEVSAEEFISGNRVDYGFYLNERPQFYVEAKAAKEDLNREKFADQAIQYSWNKGVVWAVLTDFEGLKIFNAQNIKADLWAKQFKSINCNEFIDRFDEIWLLSKEAFLNNQLDKEAEKSGKKLLKISVSKKLYEDLNEARIILTERFLAVNPDLGKNPHLLDEGVQKILDRIIFLRVAEDRGVEAPTLRPLVRDYHARNIRAQKFLYQSMIEKFKELDEIYNSHIFAPHPSDDWEEFTDIVEQIIEKLYGQEGYYEYDFKVMSADVLGTVYEQYLGHRLAKAAKGDLFGGSNIDVAKDLKKRKQQGIYYTPEFIVDYIVKNALGPMLDKCKSIADLQKIKVLDPACGSGSFLIKAFELIRKKYEDFGSSGQYINLQILINNLYGVDLDDQAVEIARLNLLIAALEKREKLPNLMNIKNGNSLISGGEEELKKYFGKNWRDKKPFNWQEEFPEVFKQGGFDVVIGNPPYVVLESNDEQLEWLKNNFVSTQGGKVNLYKVFIEKSLNVLLKNGYLGFICPSNYLSSADSKNLRKILLEQSRLLEIIEYSEKDKVFQNVTQALTTLIIQKDNGKKNLPVHVVTNKHGDITSIQNDFYHNTNFEFISPNLVINKMRNCNHQFGEIVDGFQGEVNVSTKKSLFTEDRKDTDYLPLLRGNLLEPDNIGTKAE